MTPKYRTALFAGSFNPFTVGHKSIVDRILPLCDRVVIGIGINPDKPDEGIEARTAAVESIYAGDPRVSVARYTGLTADFARKCGASFMVRGVRSVADFEYERNLADVNLRISGIETLLLPALPELACISSSMVRELASHGHDVSGFIPDKTN